MDQILGKVKTSFKNATDGKETTSNLIFKWAIPSYLISYFIVNKAILAVNSTFFDLLLSILAIIYFAWHIYALRKCSPKKAKIDKKKLSDKEKRELGRERRRRFIRKLLLKESISKWDPIFMTYVMDIFCIAHFVSYF